MDVELEHWKEELRFTSRCDPCSLLHSHHPTSLLAPTNWGWMLHSCGKESRPTLLCHAVEPPSQSVQAWNSHTLALKYIQSLCVIVGFLLTGLLCYTAPPSSLQPTPETMTPSSLIAIALTMAFCCWSML